MKTLDRTGTIKSTDPQTSSNSTESKSDYPKNFAFPQFFRGGNHNGKYR